MPTYVDPNTCNACAGEHEGPLCVNICPNDLMTMDLEQNKGFNQEPELCSECYACVKLCPQEAIFVRGYADFVPLGASVHPTRVEGGLTWTVKFRDGRELQFTYPSRTTPVGSSDPYRDFTEDRVNDLQGQGLAGESKWLGVDKLPTLLVIGGGMAGCGAAFESKFWGEDLKVVIVDKAVIERSGATGEGLSAINCYMGQRYGWNTPEDFVHYVVNDMMGLAREDLVYDVGRHVDSSVHLLEEWGLPIWKKDNGEYERIGRWQIPIHGESLKPVTAEPARKAVGKENIYERVSITHL